MRTGQHAVSQRPRQGSPACMDQRSERRTAWLSLLLLAVISAAWGNYSLDEEDPVLELAVRGVLSGPAARDQAARLEPAVRAEQLQGRRRRAGHR